MRISASKLAAAIAGVVVLGGCAAPEQSLLDQFFGASRLRDTTALQSVSTITFEPRKDGIVRTFQITGVTPEQASGQTVTKDVTVDAPVVLPDGQTVRKTIVVTLQRVRAGDSSRWMVTGFRDAAPRPRVPPS